MLSCLPVLGTGELFELGAVLFAMAGEWVPADLVEPNPFGEQCTGESMQTILDEIGTVEHWTTKYGGMCGHSTSMMASVAHILTEGAKQWNFKPTMEKVNILYPGSTPVTWWILLNACDNTDKKLYSKLATCAQDFHPFVWNTETTEKWAVAFLRAVKDEMTEESLQWLREQYEAYGDYAGGAGPIAG